MKKYIALSLAIALTSGLCACSNEEEDIFDDSSAIRLENAKKEYAEILADQGGKWLMEYFANDSEPGYQFVITFNADQTVTVSANNYWTNYEFATDESLWAVIADNGPVLTFNSFNKVLHIFSVPDDIDNPDSPDTSENGTGHGGDYEFSFIEFFNDNNSIRLIGKKTDLTIYMHRLPADTNDEEYLAGIHTAIDNMFDSRFTPLYLTDESNGELFEMSFESVLTGIFGFRPAGDNEYFAETHTSIVNESGIRFLNEVAVVRHEGTDSIHFQNFSLQEDGSLLSTDNGASYRITAGALGNILPNSSYTWDINLDNVGGQFATILSKLANDLKTNYSGKRDLNYIRLKTGLDTEGKECCVLTVRCGTTDASYYCDITGSGSNATITWRGTYNNNVTIFLKKVTTMNDFIEYLNGKTFELTASNVTVPTTIIGTNSSDYLEFDLK